MFFFGSTVAVIKVIFSRTARCPTVASLRIAIRKSLEGPSGIAAISWEEKAIVKTEVSYLSNEKKAPGCLEYIGDSTTQLCGDCNKPL